MRILKIFTLGLLVLLLTHSVIAENTNEKLDILDQYYQKTMDDWKVPGIAIGIIKDGELIFAKGYGVKKIGGNEKVNTKTNFAIASNTKAFTAAGIMILAEEGKLNLEDKVQKYLPWFELYDPYVSKNITVLDLLCHRSGLKTFSGDLLWHASTYTPEEVVKRAKYLKQAYGFRQTYGYQNIMYLAAGLILEKVSGQTWDDFIRERFLNPLKMDRTITSVEDLEKIGNYVSPHFEKDGKVISIPYINWDNAKALGGLISNVEDVSQWLILNLNQGIWNGDTIFSPQSQHLMFTQHIAREVSERTKENWPSTHFKGYGLGWGLQDYKGRKIISHTGGYEGTITATLLVPEENLGMVILTNKITSVYSPIMFKTLDVFLDAEEKDWSNILLKLLKESDKVEKKHKINPDLNKKARALKLEKYAGKYSGDLYGDVTVKLKNKKLYIQFDHTPIFKGKLKHINGNIFEVEFLEAPSLPKGMVEFYQKGKKITGLEVEFVNPDFDFTELDFTKQN